jgi:UDP-N-acetyl-D-mannosaminuronic acid transferase (WecB/TagA/CpsF family)
MDALVTPRIRLRAIIVGVGTLAILWGARQYNYAFFHSLAELFAVTVAVGAFMVMWNSRRYIEDNYLLLIGVSFLFIASLDVLHLLTYRGMGIFPGIGDDPPTQFWIAGRFLQAAVLLVAPSFIHHRRRVRTWITWLGAITAGLALAVVTGAFPCCLGPEGLTPFKIAAEGLIILMLLGAYARLRRHSAWFDSGTLALVSASILISAVSEAAFTLYRDPFGPMNLVGHFLRIIAFFLLYRATVVKALTEPYAVLFRQLAQSAEALSQSERQLRRAKRFSDAMNTIDAQMISTLDLDEIMRRVIVEGAHAIAADSASIVMRDDSSWVVRHTYRFADGLINIRLTEEMATHLSTAAQTGSPLYVRDARNSDVVNPVFAKEHDIYSLLSVPLRESERTIGILTFHKRHADDHFTPEAIDFAARLGSALTLAIENVRLYAAQREVADTLQRAMLSLPDRLPGVTIAHTYRSADRIALIGGDFYDALALADGRIAFFVGDVSGKGIEAATSSSMARTTLRAFAHHEGDPSTVLTHANGVLYNMFADGKYATVTLGVLDTSTGTVLLASAGHPDPYVCGIDGCTRHVAERDVPLGLFPDTTFSESRLTLKPGQVILLYSDGLIDTRRGKEFFGEARVHEILDEVAALEPEVIVDTLIRSTEDFSGSQFTDDIALMALRYTPETA